MPAKQAPVVPDKSRLDRLLDSGSSAVTAIALIGVLITGYAKLDETDRASDNAICKLALEYAGDETPNRELAPAVNRWVVQTLSQCLISYGPEFNRGVPK